MHILKLLSSAIVSIFLFTIIVPSTFAISTSGEAGTLDTVFSNIAKDASSLSLDPRQGVAGVSDFSGDLQYSYPITVPQGRNGLTPEIGFDYRSSTKNANQSELGMGWELNLAKIERFSRSGVQDLYINNKFFISFPENYGELVAISVDANGYGEYRSEVENGYIKYEFLSGNSWKVTSPSGVIYTFGDLADAQVQSPDTTKTLSWHLTKIEDTYGNAINYSYVKSQGNVYLKNISYGSDIYPFEVRFEPFYSGAIESFSTLPSYDKGFAQVDRRDLLDSIEVIDSISGDKTLYELGYGNWNNEGIYYLSSIQKKGINVQGTLSESPTIFSYGSYDGSRSYAPTLPENAKIFVKYPFENGMPDSYGYESKVSAFGDYDGDGWFDVIGNYWWGTDYERNTYINNKNGTWSQIVLPSTTWVPQTNDYDVSTQVYKNLSFIDTNGNSRANAVQSTPHYSSLSPLRYYQGEKVDNITYMSFAYENNGDGLVDYMSFSDIDYSFQNAWKNTGNGLVPESVSLPFDLRNHIEKGSARFFDVNGDGLDDIVILDVHEERFREMNSDQPCFINSNDTVTQKVLLNNGDNSFSDVSADITFPPIVDVHFFRSVNRFYTCHGNQIDETRKNGLVHLLDMNHDGLIDFNAALPGGTEVIYYNTGSGWELKKTGNFYYAFERFSLGREMMDINYDGITEQIFYMHQSNGYPVSGVKIGGFTVKDSPVLTGVRAPTGGSFAYEYTPASAYTNADGTSANPELPLVRLTLSKMTEDDGMGNRHDTMYHYSGGKLYRPNTTKGIQQQELLGFQKVVKTFADGSSIESEYEQGDAASKFASKGLLKKSKVLNSSGDVLQEERNEYQTNARVAGKVYAAEKTKNITIRYSEHDAGVADATASALTHDIYGNLTQEIDYGLVTLTGETAFTDSGVDKQTQSFEYAIDAAKHLLSFPKRVVRTDYNGATVGESKNYYDGLAYGQIDKGSVTKNESLVVAPSTYISSLTEYNTLGLPIKTTNARGYDTTTTYDTHNLYPASITNAKVQMTQYAYDYLSGLVKTVTDPNGAKTVNEYDALGRLISVQTTDPANTLTEFLQRSIVYTTASVPHSKTETVYTQNAGVDQVSKNYFDGFSRNIQTRTEAEGTNNYMVVDRVYDSRGNLIKEYLPVFQTGIAHTAEVTSNPKNEFTYDALKRVTSVTNSLGTSSTEYRGLERRAYDGNGERKDLILDAFGNQTAVKEYVDGAAHATLYTYDANKNLTKVTDALGNIRNMTYDLAGRKLSEEDLHTPSDSTFGTHTWTYDANSNVLSQADPKAQVTSFSYDELDRMTAEDFAGAVGIEATYVYDAGTHGIGRLSSVTSDAVAKSFTYDVLGRVRQEQKTIDAIGYDTSFTYDALGNVLSITYPDAMVVSYSYDNAAQLGAVSKDGASVVTNIDRSPLGSFSQIDFNNGISTVNTYDLAKLYRLTHKISTNASAKKVQDLAYSYDAVGNMLQVDDMSDTPTFKTVDYAYDDLYRLTQSSVVNARNGANYDRTYAYDVIGNMLHKSDIGALAYRGNDDTQSNTTNAHPHAVTTVASQGYTYDDNGNLLADGSWTHTWDYKNRLTSSTDGTTTIDYTYDETGKRVQKTNATTGKVTTYVSRHYNIEDGNVKKFIFAGAEKVATVTGENRFADSDPACMPPAIGDWNIISSCTFTGFSVVHGDVIVNDAVTLTIAADAVLEMSSATSKYQILGTGKVSFDAMGKAREMGSSDTADITSTPYLVYHHSDHLGGANIDTDTSGDMLEYVDYYPYGATRSEVSSEGYENDYKFTGKEQDEDTGLYYYEARYYDADIGRFVSVDPWAGDISDPQSLNKYSYVKNNPLKYVDPEGENPILAAMVVGAVSGYAIGGAIDAGLQLWNTGAVDWQQAGDSALVGAAYGAVLGPVGEVAGPMLSKAAAPVLSKAKNFFGKGTGSIDDAIKASKKAGISGGDSAKIQNAANASNLEINVVGSRASGRANAMSDWDYVIENGASKQIKNAKRYLPRGAAGGEINASGRETGIDIFRGSVKADKPSIKFKPDKHAK